MRLKELEKLKAASLGAILLAQRLHPAPYASDNSVGLE